MLIKFNTTKFTKFVDEHLLIRYNVNVNKEKNIKKEIYFQMEKNSILVVFLVLHIFLISIGNDT